jgi:predicted short-subunit dehydrogenase-like oxidoreductase (DUF2520 family)
VSAPASLDGLRFSLVGAGRVGGSIAHWARGRGARLHQVASRSRERAAALAARLGGEVVDLADLATAEDDLLLLAVTDPAIAEVATRLASRPQAVVALHTSGLYGEEVLSSLADNGSEVGAWHPLLAFPTELTDVAAAHGAVFAVAGSPAAERLARRLTAAFGGLAVAVPAASRPAYHAAAALAAGGLVTVLATAADIASRSGLPEEVLEGYLRLARGALEGAANARPPIAAATGPAARGDAAALARHLEGLRAAAPEAVPLAVELALATLRLQAAARPLSAEQEATRRWLEARRE